MDGLQNNEVGTEADSSAVVLLAEGLVLLLSLLRIFVVALVLAVNIIALRGCSSRNAKCHCLYLYVSDSIKICSVVYITSWIPFLIYTMLNGRWLVIDKQIFCMIQNYITNSILLVLLAISGLALFSKIQGTRKLSPKLAAGYTLAAWFIPQLAYFIILTSLDSVNEHNNQEFYWMDDLLGSNNEKSTTAGVTYTIGFTICGHTLCRMALAQYTLQYMVIILPICITSGLVCMRNNRRLRATYSSYRYTEDFAHDKLIADNDCATCNCGRGTSRALEMILSCIFLWLVLIRPMIVFIWSPEHLFDLGSHILLSVTAVFAPILPQQKRVRQVKVFRIDPASAMIHTSKECAKQSDEA